MARVWRTLLFLGLAVSFIPPVYSRRREVQIAVDNLAKTLTCDQCGWGYFLKTSRAILTADIARGQPA
jgi:hypothetical protein